MLLHTFQAPAVNAELKTCLRFPYHVHKQPLRIILTTSLDHIFGKPPSSLELPKEIILQIWEGLEKRLPELNLLLRATIRLTNLAALTLPETLCRLRSRKYGGRALRLSGACSRVDAAKPSSQGWKTSQATSSSTTKSQT